MIVDLVSPWCAALEAPDPILGRSTFRHRHAPLLELLRRARTPQLDTFPLAGNITSLRHLARRAADPALQQQIRAALATATDLGADQCRGVTLLAGDHSGDAAEALPWPEAITVLLLDGADDDDQVIVALGRAVAAITRWSATDSQTLVHEDSARGWDRWEASRNIPLREWIYTEGVGLHVAFALLPNIAPHRLLGVTAAAFARLRQREKIFRALLNEDLDQRGIGLVLRWLTPGATLGPRTIGEVVLPPLAGRYLAWRMLSERVARIGLREAIRAEA